MRIIKGGRYYPWVGKIMECRKCEAKFKLEITDKVLRIREDPAKSCSYYEAYSYVIIMCPCCGLEIKSPIMRQPHEVFQSSIFFKSKFKQNKIKGYLT